MVITHSLGVFGLAEPYVEKKGYRKPGPATKDLARINESNFEMCKIIAPGPYIKAMIKGSKSQDWPTHDGQIDDLIKGSDQKAQNVRLALSNAPEMFWIYSTYDKADYGAVKGSASLKEMLALRDKVFLPQLDAIKTAADVSGTAVMKAMFTLDGGTYTPRNGKKQSVTPEQQFAALKSIVAMGSESFLKKIEALAGDNATTEQIIELLYIRPDLAVAAGYVAVAANFKAAQLREKARGFQCVKGQPDYTKEAAKWKKLGDMWMKIALRAAAPYKGGSSMSSVLVPVGRSFEVHPIIVGAFDFEAQVTKFDAYWKTQPAGRAAIAKRQAIARGKYFYRNGKDQIVRFERPVLTRAVTFGGRPAGASVLFCSEPKDKKRENPYYSNRLLYTAFMPSLPLFSSVSKAFIFDAHLKVNMECGEPPKAPRRQRRSYKQPVPRRRKPGMSSGGFKLKLKKKKKWQ